MVPLLIFAPRIATAALGGQYVGFEARRPPLPGSEALGDDLGAVTGTSLDKGVEPGAMAGFQLGVSGFAYCPAEPIDAGWLFSAARSGATRQAFRESC